MAGLDHELREAVDAQVDYRWQNFQSAQENIIRQTVDERIKAVEAERRSRLQFLTALGGAGLVAVAVLVWDAINNTAADTARETATASIEEARQRFAELVAKSEDQLRRIETAEGNVKNALVQVEEAMSKIRVALGEIEAAQGKVAYMNDVIQIRSDLTEIKRALEAAKTPPVETSDQTGNRGDSTDATSAEEWFRQNTEEGN